MGDLFLMAPRLAYSVPGVVTLVVGVVLLCVRRRQLAPRAWSLGVAGLGVLLAGALADVVGLVLLEWLIHGGGLERTTVVFAGASLLFMVLDVLGTALLIAGLLSTARPADPWDQPPPGPRPELG
ncbi:hypothetical protein AB0H83_15500 [Dactylosporangium sp. NPDC050688]|uniref:hypothetical protein n=1 Tax=Dactylosporangium sp. NPDC050688 TaxID=3157217 RepID=UPI0033CB4099